MTSTATTATTSSGTRPVPAPTSSGTAPRRLRSPPVGFRRRRLHAVVGNWDGIDRRATTSSGTARGGGAETIWTGTATRGTFTLATAPQVSGRLTVDGVRQRDLLLPPRAPARTTSGGRHRRWLRRPATRPRSRSTAPTSRTSSGASSSTAGPPRPIGFADRLRTSSRPGGPYRGSSGESIASVDDRRATRPGGVRPPVGAGDCGSTRPTDHTDTSGSPDEVDWRRPRRSRPLTRRPERAVLAWVVGPPAGTASSRRPLVVRFLARSPAPGPPGAPHDEGSRPRRRHRCRRPDRLLLLFRIASGRDARARTSR